MDGFCCPSSDGEIETGAVKSKCQRLKVPIWSRICRSMSTRSFSFEYLKVAAMSKNKSNKFSFLVNDWKGSKRLPHVFLGGGFKHFICSPLPGEMIQFDLRIFFRWVGSTINHFVIGEAVMISTLSGGEFDFDVGLYGVPWVMTRYLTTRRFFFLISYVFLIEKKWHWTFSTEFKTECLDKDIYLYIILVKTGEV